MKTDGNLFQCVYLYVMWCVCLCVCGHTERELSVLIKFFLKKNEVSFKEVPFFDL